MNDEWIKKPNKNNVNNNNNNGRILRDPATGLYFDQNGNQVIPPESQTSLPQSIDLQTPSASFEDITLSPPPSDIYFYDEYPLDFSNLSFGQNRNQVTSPGYQTSSQHDSSSEDEYFEGSQSDEEENSQRPRRNRKKPDYFEPSFGPIGNLRTGNIPPPPLLSTPQQLAILEHNPEWFAYERPVRNRKIPDRYRPYKRGGLVSHYLQTPSFILNSNASTIHPAILAAYAQGGLVPYDTYIPQTPFNHLPPYLQFKHTQSLNYDPYQGYRRGVPPIHIPVKDVSDMFRK